jgi:hypothetical protein
MPVIPRFDASLNSLFGDDVNDLDNEVNFDFDTGPLHDLAYSVFRADNLAEDQLLRDLEDIF